MQPTPENLIGPFVESTQRSFETMLRISVSEVKLYEGEAVSDIYDVSAIMGLGGESRMAVIVSCPHAVAQATTARLLGDDEDLDEQMIVDAMGEIVNVIAGAAKPGLRAIGFGSLAMSLPTVVLGGDHRVFRKSGVQSFLAILVTPLGRFSLQVCMSEEAPPPLKL